MREVEDSPNRCPRCQRVQLSAEICEQCEAISALLKALREQCEILEECRLIVANLPGDESLFLAKIDAALKGVIYHAQKGRR